MKDKALLESLEEVFHLETRSFVRYVYDVAGPLVEDAWDEKAHAVIEEWYLETRGHLGTIQRMLEKEDYTPGPSNWPLHHAQCNMLKFRHLVRIFPERMRPTFEAIERELENLEAWPDAAAVVRDLLKRERSLQDKLVALLDEPDPGSEKAEKGQRRSVSANFW